MKIAIIEPHAHEAGHYSQELHSFCNYLKDDVSSIHVLTPYGFKDPWQPIERCTVSSLEKKFSVPNNIIFRLYGYQWEFYRQAVAMLKTDPVDIVHLWGVKSVFPAYYHFRSLPKSMVRVVTLKTVLRARDALAGRSPFGKIQEKLSQRFLLQLADTYVVHTDDIYNQAILIGIESSMLQTLGLGIEPTISKLSKRQARIQLRMPLSAKLILFFGVIREEKGVYEVLQRLDSFPPNVRLILAGENWLGTEFADLVKSRTSSGIIIDRLGYLDQQEVEPYFRSADAVMISHQKMFRGLSGVLLQALQYETPVVAVEGSHAAAFVREHAIGAVFNFAEQNSLRNVCDKIFKHQKDYRRTLHSVRNKYIWPRVVKEYHEMYSQILKSKYH